MGHELDVGRALVFACKPEAVNSAEGLHKQKTILDQILILKSSRTYLQLFQDGTWRL